MIKFNMEVSKKVDGAYQKVGEVPVYFPLFSELDIPVESTKTDEDGMPVFENEKHGFVYAAVVAAVKAQARNKLVSGTATLKAGLTIAETVEELLETGGNKGEALAAIRECLAAFKAWLPSTGKPEKTQAALLQLMKSKDALSIQSEEKKQKFSVYVQDFAASLKPEQVSRFERHLTAINDACQEGDALDLM